MYRWRTFVAAVCPLRWRRLKKKARVTYLAEFRSTRWHAVYVPSRVSIMSFHPEFLFRPSFPRPSILFPAQRAETKRNSAMADYLFIPGHVIEIVMVHFEEFSCRAFANYPSLFPYYSQLNYFWLQPPVETRKLHEREQKFFSRYRSTGWFNQTETLIRITIHLRKLYGWRKSGF